MLKYTELLLFFFVESCFLNEGLREKQSLVVDFTNMHFTDMQGKKFRINIECWAAASKKL